MLIRNATLADGRVRDVRVEGETIAAVGEGLTLGGDRGGDADDVLDAGGKLLLPGVVDAHVHFRQPGAPHKETWETGSKSAAAGGVTTVVDQPNTDPPTVTGAAFDEKAALARPSTVDYGLNGGVTPDWDPESLFDRPLFALGEVFLADSTGDMGIGPDLFRDAVDRAAAAGMTVTVHAEDADRFDESARERDRGDVAEGTSAGSGRSARDADAWSAYRTAEAEIAAVETVCDLAGETDADLHVAHTSTPEAVDLAAEAGLTCEVTPHHVFCSRDDYDELGTLGRMNPPLRSEERREALFERLADGTVDLVATDHAPHTRAEKGEDVWAAASGVPGVETSLPLLLEAARQGELSYERVRDLTAANPAEVFDLPRKGKVEEGRDADLVLVDPDAAREIRAADLHTRCDWTPFEGRLGVFPELTMVRGTVVYRDVNGGRSDAGELTPRESEFAEAVGENVRGSQD